MRRFNSFVFLSCLTSLGVLGCAAPPRPQISRSEITPPSSAQANVALPDPSIEPVGFEYFEENGQDASSADFIAAEDSVDESFNALIGLHDLEQLAVSQNPSVIRLHQQYQAAAARSQFADKLPDPKLGANVFGNPIETASGSQRANMSIVQTIPWLARLEAQQKKACLEAFAVLAEYQAERLNVLASIRIQWARLFVIDRQIAITEANQVLLKSLIEIANAKIAVGKATQGDVLLASLELSKIEERLLNFQRQRRGVEAEINRLTAQPATTPIPSPGEIPIELPVPSYAEIYQIALQSQPEIEAAHLRTQATQWGIEVARLSRRPELTLSANYFFTSNNRPPSTIVSVGEDPWSIGAQISVPIWRRKYDAMHNAASWEHHAAHSKTAELYAQYDAMIFDLTMEGKRAAEIAQLYRSTILPQAKQTLAADQKSYATGDVDFDRVIRDFRNLLTLELGFHKAIGDLAVSNARLRQAAGVDIPLSLIESIEDGTPLQINDDQ